MVIQGKGLWRGNVSTYTLIRHPQVKRCYAWGNRTPEGGWDVVTVLEIPPVASAETAVRAAILNRASPGKSS